eukprot:gene16392-7794_t
MCHLKINLRQCFYIFFLISSSLYWKIATPLALWTKVPPSIQYIEEGSNATIAWDYDLNGEVIQFAKWGKLKSDNGWDKSFIMRSFNAAKAQVVASFADKINWIANATMVIINVTVQDSGIYGCSIDLLSGRNIISSMQLNVFRLAKASDANMTNHISVKPIEGGHLILHFEAVSNYPPSGVWFAKDNEVKYFANTNSTREIIGTEGASNVYRFKLLKSNIHRNDSGLYQGYVTFGGAKYWFKNFTVLVRYSPGNSTEFRTSTGSTILLRGTTATLSCKAVSYPDPHYEITKSMTSLSNNSNGNFSLRNIATEHEGMYFCHAKNEIGDGAVRSLNVEVGDVPQITNSAKKHHYIPVGDTLLINCTAIAWPVATMMWIKDGMVEMENKSTHYLTPRESSSFFIQYDVKSNLRPKVVWTRDSVPISGEFNVTMEILKEEANLTHYRFSLMKNNVRPTDSGVYNAIISYGDHKYRSRNYNISVEEKDDDAWVIPLIIGFAGLILLIFAVFCGTVYGRRIRDYDRERTPRNGMVPNAEETGAFSAVRVADGDSKEVKFKKKNDGNGEELGQTNNGFHRDSIYRFTVNPMFSSPEARQENARSEDEDGRLPISNAIYLPTNMNYDTDEASITLESELSREENYLSSPAETNDEQEADGQEPREEASLEDTTEDDELANNETWELEQLGLDDLGAQDVEVLEEEIQAQENEVVEEQDIDQGKDDTDMPSKSFILPPIVSQKQAPDEVAYSFELFDFRTSGL